MTLLHARADTPVGRRRGQGARRMMRGTAPVVASVALFAMTAQAWAKTTLPDFQNLVSSHGPAVVSISTTRQTAALGRGPQTGPGQGEIPEFFQRFFDRLNNYSIELKMDAIGSWYLRRSARDGLPVELDC